MPFKLSVKNFGPIKAANLELTRVNVFVGPQSSGKSTILKIASFCNWLEKQIQLSQNPLEWATPQTVKDNLLTFHRLEGFADVNSEILFKSETMAINIRFKEKSQIGVDFEWSKSKHWNYTRTKNTYIPAERNIVAAIPNWMDINFDRFNNVRNYMAEWGISRKLFDKKNKLDILDMGVSYFYDQSDETDKISLNGKTLKFRVLNAELHIANTPATFTL
jgi:AAA15 family ATPase/GTPase